jgi:CheY-like chemotaxis protein
MKKTDTILVVDDNDAGRYVKVRVLERGGYPVLSAATGKDALDLVQQSRPSVVVLDVKLPDISGLEVCRAIKSRDPSILVLQTSAAFTEKTDRVAGLAGGADSYLVEPMEPAELTGTIEALLRLRRAEQDLRQVNDALEVKVAERTGELAEANEKLRQEMSQRAAAEEALRHTQKLDILGQLTGGIAHDFNNLLAIILGNLESLRRHLDPADTKIGRYADNAYYGARRAATLTRQLLAFSRRQSLAPRPLQLMAVISDIVALMRQTLGERVAVKPTVSTTLWPVFVDRGELEAAILNLAVNARDAMGGGGEIDLIVENATLEPRGNLTAGDYVSIAIRDAGVGMSQDVIRYAFEPFFTTKDIGHGTGLGLAQVHGFITQAGGGIDVQSVEGEGTTMTLYLPRYHGEVEVDLPAVVAPVEKPKGQRVILVVEDNDHVRSHALEMLRELGYQTHSAADGKSALDILSRHKIDLLFSDVGLPGGMDGADIADRARELSPDLPVLLATGYARPPTGALSYPILSKPYTFADLGRKLQEMLTSQAGLRVLVVEDESLIRLDVVDALRERGFEVEEAASAAMAKQVMQKMESSVDALVVDLGLPDQKGDDLAAEVRAKHPLLPIIIASGYAGQSVHARFRADPNVAFVEKPYNVAQLEDAIGRLRRK